MLVTVPALNPVQVVEEFGSETTGIWFHIVNIWLVHLTRGLISVVNNNHMDINLQESLVYVYSESIVNNRSKIAFFQHYLTHYPARAAFHDWRLIWVFLNFPVNTQRHNNVVTMSLQRRDVAATLYRRCGTLLFASLILRVCRCHRPNKNLA